MGEKKSYMPVVKGVNSRARLPEFDSLCHVGSHLLCLWLSIFKKGGRAGNKNTNIIELV